MSQITSSEPIAPPEEALGPEGAKKIEGRSPLQLFWMRFRRDRVALAGAVFIIFLIIAAVLAPLFVKFVSHRGPNYFPDDTTGLTNDFNIPIVGPGGKYWGGVDTLGRDVFVRTLYGARTTLQVALSATLIAVIIGVVLGLFAGFYGGKVDTVVSRLIDIFLSLPVFLLAIGLSAACGTTIQGCKIGPITLQPGVMLVTLIIAFFGWPYMARIVRGQAFSVREREFVEAARSTGYGSIHIMFREILPMLVAPIIVYTTLLVPTNIIFEASLSYLGVGIPPGTPSWGQMISDATSGQLYLVSWWMLLFPGLCLVFITLAFNLVGDGLRDALDPRTGR
jgi:peptide/nickel transport system permease protein